MEPLDALYDVRMRTEDDIRASLRQRLRQRAHAFWRFRAVLRPPMRQNDNDIRAVYTCARDILRHFLNIHQRKHAAGIVLRLFPALVAQAIGIGQHGDLHPVDIHHRCVSASAVRIDARISQRAAGQLAEGQIQPVITLIQRAFRRQRDQIDAARAKRIEELRRRIVISIAFFAPRRRRFQRDDRQIRRAERIAQSIEYGRKIVVIAVLLRTFADSLRRIDCSRRRKRSW